MQENKFKLKIINWIDGVYKTVIKLFDSLTEAIRESKLYKGLVKIYNYLDQLVHSNNPDCENYA